LFLTKRIHCKSEKVASLYVHEISISSSSDLTRVFSLPRTHSLVHMSCSSSHHNNKADYSDVRAFLKNTDSILGVGGRCRAVSIQSQQKIIHFTNYPMPTGHIALHLSRSALINLWLWLQVTYFDYYGTLQA